MSTFSIKTIDNDNVEIKLNGEHFIHLSYDLHGSQGMEDIEAVIVELATLFGANVEYSYGEED